MLKFSLLSIAGFVAVLGLPLAQADIQTEQIDYKVGEVTLSGYLAYDDAIEGKRPGILVVHEWWGHNPYARSRAEQLAAEGYTAFALDMYGAGKLASHPKDAKQFMSETMADLDNAEQRFRAAKDVLKQQATVDHDKLAAIGYCFGGGVVLHMARVGTEMDAVVSFHGSLAPNKPVAASGSKPRVLVLNGADDPFVKPEQIAAFEKEMQAANITYELVNYPGATHSFTNPDADKFGKEFNMPLAYNEEVDKASWSKMKALFDTLFK